MGAHSNQLKAMGYTDREKSFYDSHAAEYIRKNDLPEKSLQWSVEQRAAFIRHMALVIIDSPHIFSAEQVERAMTQIDYTPAEEAATGLIEHVKTFFGEAGKQADRINPFSTLNLSKTHLIVGVAIVAVSAVIAYKFTPKIPQK
jgi:hypothetical protein